MKLLKSKAVLMILGLLLGVGAALGVTLAFGETLGITKAGGQGVKIVERPKLGIMVPLPERIVNLSDSGVMRYLKVTIVLEMADLTLKELPKGEEYAKKQGEMKKEMGASLPVISDELTSILTGKSAAELMSVEGKQKLRDDIRSRINRALEKLSPEAKEHQEVLSVYFSDFIIQ